MTDPTPEWLAGRAARARAALAQTPASHLGPAARMLTTGPVDRTDADHPHEAVRAFLTELAREALPSGDPDVIACTPAGTGVLADGSWVEFVHRELTVTALQDLLDDYDSLLARLAERESNPAGDPASDTDDAGGLEFSPAERVLYGLADQPLPHYSPAEIAMMDEQSAVSDAEAEALRQVRPDLMTMHVGRSFGSRRHIEDACPCPQEPCGLISMNRIDPKCQQHNVRFGKTTRQSHTPAQCAEVTAALGDHNGPPREPGPVSSNAWMGQEFDRAQARNAQLPPGARPVVTLPTEGRTRKTTP